MKAIKQIVAAAIFSLVSAVQLEAEFIPLDALSTVTFEEGDGESGHWPWP